MMSTVNFLMQRLSAINKKIYLLTLLYLLNDSKIVGVIT